MDIKYIKVDLSEKTQKNIDNREHEESVPKKRVVTQKGNWIFKSPETQFNYIQQIINSESNNVTKLILQQIGQKISGYKSQDIEKDLYQKQDFITLDKVLELMIETENRCFYCKEIVHVLYENVREPKQWSLDRIENDKGHNNDNVMIACLNCNLRRKTMYHERYAFTKQLNIVKKQI